MLENNSKEMATIVETFVIEETANLIYDNESLDRWNSLVSKLGLEGQTKIVSSEKSPIPFMFIKKTMQNVFETLCPRKVDISEYNVTPIPVEILDLVALSVNEDYFSKIQIWYDDIDPDPLCIGVAEKYRLVHPKTWANHEDTSTFKTMEDAKEYISSNGIDAKPLKMSGESKLYLLGKWADVKQSFEELTSKAKARFISTKGNQYRKDIKEAQRNLDDLETEAFDLFGS